MDLTCADWRKASYSASGNCVEVARNLPGLVAVRDSKDPGGPVLLFTAEQWQRFTAAIVSDAVPRADHASVIRPGRRFRLGGPGKAGSVGTRAGRGRARRVQLRKRYDTGWAARVRP